MLEMCHRSCESCRGRAARGTGKGKDPSQRHSRACGGCRTPAVGRACEGYRIFPRIESKDFNASTALVPEEVCPRDPTVADCCPSVWEALKFARSDLLVKIVRLEARVVILVYDPSGSCRSSVCVVLKFAQPVHRSARNSRYFMVYLCDMGDLKAKMLECLNRGQVHLLVSVCRKGKVRLRHEGGDACSCEYLLWHSNACLTTT
jgi:hypothetical protein